MIWNELGIGGGTALVVLCALYSVVKWAVRNGSRAACAQLNGGKGRLRQLWEAVLSEERPAEQEVGR